MIVYECIYIYTHVLCLYIVYIYIIYYDIIYNICVTHCIRIEHSLDLEGPSIAHMLRACSEPAPRLRPMLQPIYDMPLEASRVFSRAKDDFPRLILMDDEHLCHPYILGIIIIIMRIMMII